MRGIRRLVWVVGLLGLTVLPVRAVQTDASPDPVPRSDRASYVVLMQQPPAVAYQGGLSGLPRTRPGPGARIDPANANVQRYAAFLRSAHDRALASVGAATGSKVNEYVFALNGFSAMLSPGQAADLRQQAGVVAVLPDELRFRQTDSSGDFLGLSEWNGAWRLRYTGEDVVIGVIDDGIWPEHPSFADDGSYRALPAYAGLPCEFGNTAHNPNDAPFTCNNKLLGARQVLASYRALVGAEPDEFDSARDDNGHGTHTASTAGGNAGVEAQVAGTPLGAVSGVAPRARIIAYKALGNLGGFTSDLAAAIDQAVADGVHVINYSIGSSGVAVAADEIAFLFAADAGVFVANSNGNSGPAPATTGSPASVPWLTSVGASTQSRFFQGAVRSSQGWEVLGASIAGQTEELPLIDAAAAGSELCLGGGLNPALVTGKIVLCKRGVTARAAKSEAVHLAGGAGMILYNSSDAESLATDTHWVPSVHVSYTDGLAIKGYIASAAGAATARIEGGIKVSVPAPRMADFSSRGPNRLSGDIVKPDITAPGVQILAGWSPFPDPGQVPGQLFAAINGTSMASPHVAGIFALLKQAHPDWTPAMAKSAIMTTAYQEVTREDGLTPADPFDMGAGHLNPGSPAVKGSAFQPGLVYDAGLLDYIGFSCGAGLEIFTAGECAHVASLGIPSDPSDLNLPSIGIDGLPGAQTVRRTVTSVAQEGGWREYMVSVDAPPGFSVSVEPSTLRLRRGESATYEVTIVNTGAVPAGQWRHGSLTWTDKSGSYRVRSPISVNATAFVAPETVPGSGESGSASFDVRFGYTGSYTAAAHGLVPATRTTDIVSQDPDQNFNPGDGFSRMYSIPVSGAALLRFALPPEATEAGADLDLYLFGPTGGLIGQSDRPGTDERIEVVLPADGTYTLFVHGYTTPGGDSGYTLYSWVVSATPGGNMTVVSAPTSAVVGAQGSVEVEWSGATTGEWHLGAVSHTGDGGLLGLTRVEVDNR